VTPVNNASVLKTLGAHTYFTDFALPEQKAALSPKPTLCWEMQMTPITDGGNLGNSQNTFKKNVYIGV
jgi:hypothetical protein